jgi:hypothetical protein
MKFTLRTRRASGVSTEKCFATEFEGVKALQSELDVQRKGGNTVTPQHPLYVYIVTDTAGRFVQRTELIFPG